MKKPSLTTLFPQQVMSSLQNNLWNYNATDFSFFQLSHRSVHYANLNNSLSLLLKQFYQIPDDYEILYLSNGLHFSAIPFNFLSLTQNNCLYVITDEQDKKHIRQAEKLCSSVKRINYDQVRQKTRSALMKQNIKAQQVGNGCKYKFYTHYRNKYFQLQAEENELLVCHMDPFNNVLINKHAMVYFQTGYSLGTVGMCVIIIRKDLLGAQLKITPDLMNFNLHQQMKSVVNTPFTFAPLVLQRHLQFLIKYFLTPTRVKEALKTIQSNYICQMQSREIKVLNSLIFNQILFELQSNINQSFFKQLQLIAPNQYILKLQLQNINGSQQFVDALLN